MRTRNRLIAGLITLGLCAMSVGQTVRYTSDIDTGSFAPIVGADIQQVSCEDGSCDSGCDTGCDSCAPTCGAPDACCDSCGGCSSGCLGGCGLSICNCCLGDAWTLSGAVHGDCPPCITIGGWFSAGYHTEDNGLFNRFATYQVRK